MSERKIKGFIRKYGVIYVGIHTFVRVFYYAPVNGKNERIRDEAFVKRRKWTGGLNGWEMKGGRGQDKRAWTKISGYSETKKWKRMLTFSNYLLRNMCLNIKCLYAYAWKREAQESIANFIAYNEKLKKISEINIVQTCTFPS